MRKIPLRHEACEAMVIFGFTNNILMGLAALLHCMWPCGELQRRLLGSWLMGKTNSKSGTAFQVV